MSKQREALKLALDALDCIFSPLHVREINKVGAAMGAIRSALAEPEQEPVAWISEGGDVSRSKRYMDEMGFKCEPLYTTPPARKPLTDYQICEIDELVWKELSWEEKTFGQFALKLARAIERAHGIGD